MAIRIDTRWMTYKPAQAVRDCTVTSLLRSSVGGHLREIYIWGGVSWNGIGAAGIVGLSLEFSAGGYRYGSKLEGSPGYRSEHRHSTDRRKHQSLVCYSPTLETVPLSPSKVELQHISVFNRPTSSGRTEVDSRIRPAPDCGHMYVSSIPNPIVLYTSMLTAVREDTTLLHGNVHTAQTWFPSPAPFSLNHFLQF